MANKTLGDMGGGGGIGEGGNDRCLVDKLVWFYNASSWGIILIFQVGLWLAD